MNVCLFLFLTCAWGGAYLGIHYVIAVYPPFFAAALRVLCSTALMLPFAWVALRRANLSRGTIVRCAMSGLIFTGGGFSLLFWGQRFVAPAVASILIAATAIFLALIVPFVDRGARVTRQQWVGILLGFLGVALVFIPRLRDGDVAHLLGLLAILGTALCYAIGAAMLQPITRTVPGRVIYVWQGVAAGSFLLLLSALTETWPSRAMIAHAAAANYALGFLIIVPSTIAFLIYYHLIRVWGSVAATTTVFTVPLVSLLLDVVALRQVPAWPVLVGAVIIFSGVYRVKRVTGA